MKLKQINKIPDSRAATTDEVNMLIDVVNSGAKLIEAMDATINEIALFLEYAFTDENKQEEERELWREAHRKARERRRRERGKT